MLSASSRKRASLSRSAFSASICSVTSVLVPNQRMTSPASLRIGRAQEPAVVAILATQGERVLPRRAAFETVSDALDDPIYMIRVMDLLPAPTLHLWERCPGIFIPTLVVPVDPALSIRCP